MLNDVADLNQLYNELFEYKSGKLHEDDVLKNSISGYSIDDLINFNDVRSPPTKYI
jgi:hypothetical protein